MTKKYYNLHRHEPSLRPSQGLGLYAPRPNTSIPSGLKYCSDVPREGSTRRVRLQQLLQLLLPEFVRNTAELHCGAADRSAAVTAHTSA